TRGEGACASSAHAGAESAAWLQVALKINGMTEKYVLREAARPVLTDAVYQRQKHPFVTPPATIQPRGPLFALMQDTLRGSALDGPGIYDRAKVTALLDSVADMDDAGRTRADALLMWMTSLCLVHQRMGL